jgi:hypothetical protein
MHYDVKRGVKSHVFPMDEIAHMLMPLQWLVKSLNPDGKHIVSNVYKEVYMLSSMYYDLIVICYDLFVICYFLNAI